MTMKSAPTPQPEWLYPESIHAGVDYANPDVAREYDARHTKFRDYEQGARLILERLQLTSEQEVIDLGCGTGAFVLTAANHLKKVHAVDVSEAMLARLIQKARSRGLENIEVSQAGFLSYEHKGPLADAVVSVAALHHLPDFWKSVALWRINRMLKPGGKFYLFDVVFNFAPEDHVAVLEQWVSAMRQQADPVMAEETVIHIKDEFSTMDWILEGMLQRAGFEVMQRYEDFPLCMAYIARKG